MLVESFRIGTATFILLWIVGPYGSLLELKGLPRDVEGIY
jgi:hypothetical protein